MLNFINLFKLSTKEEKIINDWLIIIENLNLLEETQKGIFEFHPSYKETWFTFFIDQFKNRIILYLLEKSGEIFFKETRDINKYKQEDYFLNKNTFIESFIEYHYNNFLFENQFQDFFNYSKNFKTKTKKEIIENFYYQYKNIFLEF